MVEERSAMVEKKGVSPWVWVAGGCGVLAILAFVAMASGLWFVGKKVKQAADDFEKDPARAAAEMVVKVNPQLELVETDQEAGKITIRDRESGEVATFDYSQVKEGKISFESDEGQVSFTAGEEGEGLMTVETEEGVTRIGGAPGELPEWLPRWPGEPELHGAWSSPEGGAFTFTVAESPAEVFDFYRAELEAAGFAVQRNTMSEGDEVTGGMLSATAEDTGRTARVMVARRAEGTHVSVQYETPPGE